MAQTNELLFGPPVDIDAEAMFRRIASGRLGVSGDTLECWFHNFAARGTQGVKSTVNGTSSIATGDRSQLLSSGAGAGTQEIYPGMGVATDPTHILSGTTPKWIIMGYFKINTAISATTKIGIGAVNPNGGQDKIVIGATGSISTANFSVFGRAGSNLDTGVAVDTSYHRWCLWRDGTNGFFQLDTSAPVSCTARPDVDAAGYCLAQETGAAAGARTMNIAWVGTACVRA